MEKGLVGYLRHLRRMEQAFLLFVLLYGILYFFGASFLPLALAGTAAFITGLVALFRLARRALRNAIWRLRNRLIAAYLFIAVVPVVLILTLVALTGYVVIGQVAVYLVNTELNQRENNLQRQADALARVPAADPQRALDRFSAFVTRNVFPNFQMKVTGSHEFQYPPDTAVEMPPMTGKRSHGLIVRKVGDESRLYAYAYAPLPTEQVIVIAPITPEVLAALAPGLGDVNFVLPKIGLRGASHIPPSENPFDIAVRGYYRMSAPLWDSPDAQENLLLVVDSRVSAVLGAVFQKPDWAELVLGILVAIAVLFLVVELFSLVAGIQLSRSITGAVHDLYEATQHVKEGDFSYRIPVKGHDQLAELGSSFNTMTENLERLIVVAKEKERLESELEIAREVQSQLFPKDAPVTATLELKGVCNPARMVSGDYYDFMLLPDHSLAFAIGDVAGKGISAALLMATIQSTMRTQLSSSNGTGPSHLSTAKMVANLNRQLYANTAPEKYATFYFGLYNEGASELRYTNAGHLAPILMRGGEMEELGSTGTVVGAFPIVLYTEKTVKLAPGDVLVAYTDGIVEPENAYGEMFGDDRLKDLLAKYAKAAPAEIIARTMEAVNQWTGAGELQDDMTMVVARRL